MVLWVGMYNVPCVVLDGRAVLKWKELAVRALRQAWHE